MEHPGSPNPETAVERAGSNEPIIWPTSEWERPLSPSGSVRRLRPRANYVQLDAQQLIQAAAAEQQLSSATQESPRVFLTSIDMHGAMPQRPATTPAQHELEPHDTSSLGQTGTSEGQLHALSAPATPLLQDAAEGPLDGSPGEPARQFTVQYMGIANGQLGILSKREAVSSRPSTAPTGEAAGSPPGAAHGASDSIDIKALADNTKGDVYEPPPAFGAFYVLRRVPGRPSERQQRSVVQESLARTLQLQKAADAKAMRTAARRASAAAVTSPIVTPCSKDFPITSRPRRLSAGGFAGWRMLPGPKLTAGGFPGQKLSLHRPDMVVKPMVPIRAQSAPITSRQQAPHARGQALGDSPLKGGLTGGRYRGAEGGPLWRSAERLGAAGMAPIAEGRARQGAGRAAGMDGGAGAHAGKGARAARPGTSPLSSPSGAGARAGAAGAAGMDRRPHTSHGAPSRPQQRPLSGTLFSFIPPEGSLPRLGGSGGGAVTHPNLKPEGSERASAAPHPTQPAVRANSGPTQGVSFSGSAETIGVASVPATASPPHLPPPHSPTAASSQPQHRHHSDHRHHTQQLDPTEATMRPAEHEPGTDSHDAPLAPPLLAAVGANQLLSSLPTAAASGHNKPQAVADVQHRRSTGMLALASTATPMHRASVQERPAARARNSGWVLQGSSAPLSSAPGAKPLLASARSEVGPWQTNGHQESGLDVGLGSHSGGS